jgi:membrane protease YdiL (CAAX protease family)
MLIAIFLIIILFVIISPYILSSDAAIPLKMLFELSPYIIMVGLVTVVCMLKKRPISIGLGFKKSHILKQLFIAVIIFAITISFIVIPLMFGANKSDVLSFKARSPFILIYYVIKAFIFVGIGEELIWRGYFYERIKEITNSGALTVVISSVLFGLWHYPNGQNIIQVLMVSGLGLIYGFARLKVKDCSTLATGVAHGLHDSIILILSYIML